MTSTLHADPRPRGTLPGHINLRRLRIAVGYHLPVSPVHRTLFEGQGT